MSNGSSWVHSASIPEFILPPQSSCRLLERLPWRQEGGRESSPDTQQNLVIGRLSEDRGYCSSTEGSRRRHRKQHTLTNDYPPHDPSVCRREKPTKEEKSAQKWPLASQTFLHNGCRVCWWTGPDSQQGRWHHEGKHNTHNAKRCALTNWRGRVALWKFPYRRMNLTAGQK